MTLSDDLLTQLQEHIITIYTFRKNPLLKFYCVVLFCLLKLSYTWFKCYWLFINTENLYKPNTNNRENGTEVLFLRSIYYYVCSLSPVRYVRPL